MRTIRLRRRAQVAIGAGGDRLLVRAARVHANFAEYVPLALLLVGRLLHARGASQPLEDLRFRVAGMAMTFTAIALAALGLLYFAITA